MIFIVFKEFYASKKTFAYPSYFQCLTTRHWTVSSTNICQNLAALYLYDSDRGRKSNLDWWTVVEYLYNIQKSTLNFVFKVSTKVLWFEVCMYRLHVLEYRCRNFQFQSKLIHLVHKMNSGPVLNDLVQNLKSFMQYCCRIKFSTKNNIAFRIFSRNYYRKQKINVSFAVYCLKLSSHHKIKHWKALDFNFCPLFCQTAHKMK